MSGLSVYLLFSKKTGEWGRLMVVTITRGKGIECRDVK